MTENRAWIIIFIGLFIGSGIAFYEISKHISLPSPSLQQVTECAR